MNVTFPRIPWPLTEDGWTSAQKWIDQMRDVFNGRISYARNLASDVVTFEFTAGSSPSKRISSSTRPLGVVALSLQQIEPPSNTPPSVSDAFSWKYEDGSLSFPAWATITGTARYRATVLVIRE